MELFERLETQITEILKEIVFLREENTVLKISAVGLEEIKDENRALKEALDNERSLRTNISSRVDSLLTMIGEHRVQMK